MNKINNFFYKTLFLLLSCFLCFSLSSCKSTTTIKTQKATFQVYSEAEEGQLDDFLSILTSRADEIIEKYNPKYNKTVKIRFFQTEKELHRAMLNPFSAEWIVGYSSTDHDLWLVNPYNTKQHSYESMKQIAAHEFTHVVLHSFTVNLPRWIHEGIACHEANQDNDYNKQLRKEKAIANELPFFTTLGDNPNSPDLYIYPLSIIEFIEAEKSQEKLMEFIRNPNVQEVFGLTENEFQEEWRQYLIKK